jgi:hypothetical protein
MGGIVESIFGGGGSSSPQSFAPIEPAKPAPTTDDSARLAEEREKARRRRGTAANVLAGDAAPTSGDVQSAAKVLLGE